MSDDGLIMLQFGVLAVGAAGGVGALYAAGVDWLVDHGVFVRHPVLALPGLADAGLDWPRIVAAAGILFAFVAVMVSATAHRIRSARKDS